MTKGSRVFELWTIAMLAISASMLSGCVSMGPATREPDTRSFSIDDKLELKMEKFVLNLPGVSVENMRYTPKMADGLFCEMGLELRNVSDARIPNSEINMIELVSISDDGEVFYSPWSNHPGQKTDIMKEMQAPYLDMGATKKHSWLFVYPGKNKVLGLSFKRSSYFGFYDDEATDGVFAKEAEYNEALNLVLTSFQLLDDSQIIDIMTQKGIGYFDSGFSPLNAYIQSIIYGKRMVLDEAIEADGDLDASFRYGFVQMRPIQLAILSNNEYAIKKLLEKGIDPKPSSGSGDGVLVTMMLDTQNIDAIKLYERYVAPLDEFKVSQGFGPKKTILEYAEAKKLDKVRDYFQSER